MLRFSAAAIDIHGAAASLENTHPKCAVHDLHFLQWHAEEVTSLPTLGLQPRIPGCVVDFALLLNLSAPENHLPESGVPDQLGVPRTP